MKRHGNRLLSLISQYKQNMDLMQASADGANSPQTFDLTRIVNSSDFCQAIRRADVSCLLRAR